MAFIRLLLIVWIVLAALGFVIQSLPKARFRDCAGAALGTTDVGVGRPVNLAAVRF